jgi:hypothetical protein
LEQAVDAVFLTSDGDAPVLFALADAGVTGNRAAAVAGLLFALGLCRPFRERKPKLAPAANPSIR